MSHLYQANALARHWLLATGRHALHEPFAYDLYESVINNKTVHPSFYEIEKLRRQYMVDRNKKDLRVLGASSRQGKRSFRQLVRSGSTHPVYARMLFRLIKFMNAKNIIELGTSLGMTSLYLSLDSSVRLLTLEGDPVLTSQARDSFHHFRRDNIRLIEGNIDDTLQLALAEHGKVDMIYFDANHRYEPTLRYYQNALNHIHESSVMVFDDIHWSKEMSRAWSEIRQDEQVTMAIDLYQLGLIFFKPFRQKYFYRLDRNG